MELYYNKVCWDRCELRAMVVVVVDSGACDMR